MEAAAAARGGVAGMNAINCLVVEPNETLQRLVHAWLVSARIHDTLVSDGEAAIAACAQYRYDLIFMDLDFRSSSGNDNTIDGFAVTSTIRCQGMNKDTPVVGWSATELPGDRATASGINDVLVKPFNKQHVEDMIATWGGLRVEPLPQLNFEEPLFDLNQLAPPDFVISELVRPKTARVLVVEDCKLTQHVICSLLKELTSNVQQAFDGEQAIMACQQQTFDVIFMDIHMPKVNGLEATHHIRNTSNKNVFTPIIAFTSSGTLQDYTLFGVNDLLKKPFTTDSLTSIFDKWTPYTRELNVLGENVAKTEAERPHGMPMAQMNMGRAQPVQAQSQQAAAAAAQSGVMVGVPQQGAVAHAVPAAVVPQAMNVVHARNHVRAHTAAPAVASGGGAGGAWPKAKAKKPNPLGHTAKEKMRRASIVNSCNAFRTLIPLDSIKDVDKATVFRISVEYMAYLRTKIAPDELKSLDASFASQQEQRLAEQTAARLDVQAEVPAEAQYKMGTTMTTSHEPATGQNTMATVAATTAAASTTTTAASAAPATGAAATTATTGGMRQNSDGSGAHGVPSGGASAPHGQVAPNATGDTRGGDAMSVVKNGDGHHGGVSGVNGREKTGLHAATPSAHGAVVGVMSS